MRLAALAVVLAACGSSKKAAPKHDAGALASADAGVPDARPREPDRAAFPGDPYEDRAVPAGTVIVTSNLPVHVVAIDVDGKIERTEHQPAGGTVELRGLVTDGTVAYHLLAMGNETAAIVPGPDAGMRVELAAPLAELREPVPEREVWVIVHGARDAQDISLVDVDTGDRVAPDGAPREDTDGMIFRFTGAKPGSIYVARLSHRTGEHVSRPLSMGTVGVGRALLATPIPMAQCDGHLFRKEQVLRGWTQCETWNPGGKPRRFATPAELPLPAGATSRTGTVAWSRPVPPGRGAVGAEYELAVTDHRVEIAMTAGIPLARLGITVEAAPQITISGVVGGTHQPPALGQGEVAHFVFIDTPKEDHQLRFVIDGIYPPTPCELLGVAKWTATGEPAAAPDVSAKLRDGSEVKLSSLRGKPVLLNLFASWTPPSAEEAPKLIAAHRAFAPLGVQVVVVASDNDWAAVDKLIDPSSGITVWLDPPGDVAYTLGKVAHAFGTQRLPESYLIDANGLVRHWVVNSRDWASPDALACVQTVTQPWTGTVTTAPPPYVPPPTIVGGTITVDPKLPVPPGAKMYIGLRPMAGGAPLGFIRVDGPVFPQGFAFTSKDLIDPGSVVRGLVTVEVHVDIDGDMQPPEPGDLRAEVDAASGDLGVRVKIAEMVK